MQDKRRRSKGKAKQRNSSGQHSKPINAGYDGHKGQGYQVQLAETYSRKEKLEEGKEDAVTKDNKQVATKEEEVLDLITYVKVESADKHDSKALAPALEELEERGNKPDEILVDAAYGGDDNVMDAEKKGVKVISPVIGKKNNTDYSGFEFDRKTKEVKQCPQGKQPQSIKSNKSGSITARWSKQDCFDCPLQESCQTTKGSLGRRLVYTEKDIRLWRRRKHEGSPRSSKINTVIGQVLKQAMLVMFK